MNATKQTRLLHWKTAEVLHIIELDWTLPKGAYISVHVDSNTIERFTVMMAPQFESYLSDCALARAQYQNLMVRPDNVARRRHG